MKNPEKEKQVRWIEFDGKNSESGSLNFWENRLIFPEGIQRCFWVHAVPHDVTRGKHAHRKETQVLLALSGHIEVKVVSLEGISQSYVLDNPAKGLLIPPMHWVETVFSKDAVLLGLSDREFSEDDYVREFSEFGND